jgi:hypothetical protein
MYLVCGLRFGVSEGLVNFLAIMGAVKLWLKEQSYLGFSKLSLPVL